MTTLRPADRYGAKPQLPGRKNPDNVKRKTLLALRVSGARVFSGWSVFDAPRPGVFARHL